MGYHFTSEATCPACQHKAVFEEYGRVSDWVEASCPSCGLNELEVMEDAESLFERWQPNREYLN